LTKKQKQLVRQIAGLALLATCAVTLSTGLERLWRAPNSWPCVLIDLGTLGGKYSGAFAVNAAGQVVGCAQRADGRNHAFLYTAGRMTDLGTLGGRTSTAYGINFAGHFVGQARLADDATSDPFLFTGGGLLDLDAHGGPGYTLAINTSGQVIGRCEPHVFLYSAGAGLQNLGTLGAPSPTSTAFTTRA
jgi:probable HAF family extracellular repeat protein